MGTSADSKLPEHEQRQFDLIARNALIMGWVAAADRLDAGVDGATVVIRNVRGDSHRTIRYQRTERWLLDFLADLAHGRWKW